MVVAYDALVLRPPFSGVERSVLELARALLARGAFGYRLILPPAAQVADAGALRELRAAGAARFPVPSWCRGRGPRILYELLLLPAALRRAGVSLLHAPAYVAPPRLPCPCVLSVYDLHVFTHPRLCRAANRLHYRARLPSSLRRAAAVIVPSRHTADALRRLFPAAAAKTHVIPLGVAPRWFVAPGAAAAATTPFPLPPRYLLFVGDLAPRKNLEGVVRAWELLRARDPALHLVLAGAPAGARLPAAPGLVRLGHVADEILPLLYARARALLLPSLDEGFGLPVLEAMAAGCPVVCSGGGPAEFAAGVAEFCDPRDPADIARRAAPLLAEGPERARRIAAGRERARRYDWESAAAATEEVYRSLATPPG